MSRVRQQGYAAGFRDANTGKSKNPKRHLSFFKSLIFPKYVEVFCAGYTHGYNTGMLQQRKQMESKIRKETQNANSKTLSSNRQRQLQELEKAKKQKDRGRNMER